MQSHGPCVQHQRLRLLPPRRAHRQSLTRRPWDGALANVKLYDGCSAAQQPGLTTIHNTREQSGEITRTLARSVADDSCGRSRHLPCCCCCVERQQQCLCQPWPLLTRCAHGAQPASRPCSAPQRRLLRPAAWQLVPEARAHAAHGLRRAARRAGRAGSCSKLAGCTGRPSRGQSTACRTRRPTSRPSPCAARAQS